MTTPDRCSPAPGDPPPPTDALRAVVAASLLAERRGAPACIARTRYGWRVYQGGALVWPIKGLDEEVRTW